MNYSVYNNESEINNEEIIQFLHEHLGKYGDSHDQISKAVDYAMDSSEARGGFILCAYEQDEMVGAVVINDTSMEGYISRHILVYIAVHKNYRGQGIGKNLIGKVVELCTGNIALHVEYDNPARLLYQKLGFKSKYAEMRYEQLTDENRVNEMYRKITKKSEIKPDTVNKRLKKIKYDYLNMKDEELQVKLEESLHSMVNEIFDWNNLLREKKGTLATMAKSFKDLVGISFDQQVLLNKIKSEMLNAIEKVISSKEWEYYLDEFDKMKKAAEKYMEKTTTGSETDRLSKNTGN